MCPTLQVLQDVQTRLERGGGGEGQIESKEGGMRDQGKMQTRYV